MTAEANVQAMGSTRHSYTDRQTSMLDAKRRKAYIIHSITFGMVAGIKTEAWEQSVRQRHFSFDVIC